MDDFELDLHERINMLVKFTESMNAINYISEHTNDIETAMDRFITYLNPTSRRNKDETEKVIIKMYKSGLLDALIQYKDAIVHMVDTCNRYSSFNEPIETIHNSEDILRKIKEVKDNGDNNS